MQGMDRATLIPGITYFIASSSMLLVNKLAMTYLPAPALVTTCQYLVSALSVYVCTHFLKWMTADTELRWVILRKYMIIPILFSAAIFSNGKLLQTANIETFMVFRFSTPILVALVDFAVMGKALPTSRAWLSFLLISLGAVVYAATDKGFSLTTYSWALFYLFVITSEMIVVKHIFSTIEMTDWTRVYLNNLLSLLFQPYFFFLTGEDQVVDQLDFTLPALFFLLCSCFIGLILAWSGTALRHKISATSFTVVGVTCKIVTELINWLMWEKHANEAGLMALGVCLLGSTLFVPSKKRDETSKISNSVWWFLNRVTCHCLSKAELEGPAFAREAQYAPLEKDGVDMEDLEGEKEPKS